MLRYWSTVLLAGAVSLLPAPASADSGGSCLVGGTHPAGRSSYPAGYLQVVTVAAEDGQLQLQLRVRDDGSARVSGHILNGSHVLTLRVIDGQLTCRDADGDGEAEAVVFVFPASQPHMHATDVMVVMTLPGTDTDSSGDYGLVFRLDEQLVSRTIEPAPGSGSPNRMLYTLSGG